MKSYFKVITDRVICIVNGWMSVDWNRAVGYMTRSR